MTTSAEQAQIDRASALADFHEAGNANADLLGEGNSKDPARQAASKIPLLTTKGDPADHPGATPGDAFNRSLDLPDDKFVPMGHGLRSAGEKAVTPFTQPSRDLSKSPLALTKSDLGYDPRSHH